MKFTKLIGLLCIVLGFAAVNAEADVYIDSNGNGTATGCHWITFANYTTTSSGGQTSTQLVEGLFCGAISSPAVTRVTVNGTCSSVSFNVSSGYSASGSCSGWSIVTVPPVCTLHNAKIITGILSSNVNAAMPSANNTCSACGGARAVFSYQDMGANSNHNAYYDIYCN